MGYFFNGEELITPTVASAVNDSGFFNANLNVGNTLCLIGTSSQGPVGMAVKVGMPVQVGAIFGTGDLVDAANRAFTASEDTVGPQTVILIRVGASVAASGALKDASDATVVNLIATGPGSPGNTISAQVLAASVQGLKLTLMQGATSFSGDNIYQPAFTVQYTGDGATATMTVTASTVVLTVAAAPVVTVQLSDFNTVSALVAYINAQTDFSATVFPSAANMATAGVLDFVVAQNIKAAVYTATATLQAVVNWINTNVPPVAATREAGAGTLPAPDLPTYLTGGSDVDPVNLDWANAFTLAQAQTCQIVVALSGSASVISMLDAHVQFCSTVLRKERRAYAGMILGTTDAQGIAQAALINSDRTSLIHIGMYDFNAAGVLTLYQPYILAAMVGGMRAGVNPGVSLTNKSINVQGLERYPLIPTGTDALITGGVLPITLDGDLFKIEQEISTWLEDTRFDKVLVGTGVAVDASVKAVRAALAPLKGQSGSPTLLGQAETLAESALAELAKAPPTGLGVLVGDANSPPYSNIVASVANNVLSVSFSCSPGVEVDFITASINLVPFSGTVSALVSSNS